MDEFIHALAPRVIPGAEIREPALGLSTIILVVRRAQESELVIRHNYSRIILRGCRYVVVDLKVRMPPASRQARQHYKALS